MHPSFDYPDNLPVAARREEIAAAVTAHQVVVLCGETGSGKTTQLPKICLEAGRGANGVIGHTQPRRLAARSVAARIAEETRTAPGSLVGYKIRFNDQTGPDCRIKLMTDGILLQELRRDRQLRAYDTLIIDEAHERSINVDFLLGYLRRLLPQRPDLHLVVMSATIDPQRFAEHFDGAPIIEVSGRTFPVEVRYRPPASGGDGLHEALLEGIAELRSENIAGDILVFLPGERDIRDAAKGVRQRFGPGLEVLPLFARLAAHEQDRIFAPGARPRVVLATNVAETSITVPRIAAVIDTGLARISRYSHQTKIQRLPIENISQASAQQRAGRCGRVQDGICLRLYSQDSFDEREAYTDPEILRTNLAGVLLRMADLDLGEITSFPFPDPPDPRLVRDGQRLLRELEALEGERLTRIGRQLARLPVDPRIGRMLLASADNGSVRELTVIAAALAIADPVESRMTVEIDAAEDWRHPRSEFIGLLQLWELFHRKQKELSGNQLRKWCQRNGLAFLRMREWQDLQRQLRGHCGALKLRAAREPASYAAIHRAILSGLLSQIGEHREKNEYDGARGLRFRVVPGTTLARSPKWIVAATIRQTHRAFAAQVAGVKPAWIEAVAGHLVKRRYSEPWWDPDRQRVAAYESVSLFGLVLRSRRRVDYAAVDRDAATRVFIRDALAADRYQGSGAYLEHNRALAAQLRERSARLRRTDLLPDQLRQAQFFASRLPASCATPTEFERWRRRAERENPKALFMALEDLSAALEVEPDGEEYPRTLLLGRNRFALRYRFAPGEKDDGVSLLVPVAAVTELDTGQLDWLVPGLLHEKVSAIVRGLPKALRRKLVPAPERAREFVERGPRDEPFYVALASYLTRCAAEPVSQELCREVALPDYLRLRLVACDDAGHAVAAARDLTRLRARLGGTLHEALALSESQRWNQPGLQDWSFGELPGQVRVTRQGVTIDAYPGLEDKGGHVDLRLFEFAGQARRASRRGVARLISLRLPQQAQMIRARLTGDSALALLARRAGGLDLVADEVVIATALESVAAALPTSRADYDRLVAALRPDIVARGEKLADTIVTTLRKHHALRVRLEAAPQPARADMTEQLDQLVFPGFITLVPAEWLAQYGRYLLALERRLEALEQGGNARDKNATRDVRAYWERWLEIERRDGLSAYADERALRFRFMIEEYRVSLFAQQLGTRHRVSARRLDRLFEELQGA